MERNQQITRQLRELRTITRTSTGAYTNFCYLPIGLRDEIITALSSPELRKGDEPQ